MAIHVQALFIHDTNSRLLLVNEPDGGGPAPRLYLGRTRTGNLWRFRADLPASLIEELEALCVDEPAPAEFSAAPRHIEEYLRLLETHAPVRKLYIGPAYHFTEYPEPSRPLQAITETNAEMLRGGFEDLIAELPAWQPFLALDFRGKGYAKDVVAGWARAVLSLGAIPLYGTTWENTASQAVAKKLRLATFGADFHVA